MVVITGSHTNGPTLVSIQALVAVEAVGVERLPLLAHGRDHPRAAPRQTLGGVDDGGDHGKQKQPDAKNAQQHEHSRYIAD